MLESFASARYKTQHDGDKFALTCLCQRFCNLRSVLLQRRDILHCSIEDHTVRTKAARRIFYFIVGWQRARYWTCCRCSFLRHSTGVQEGFNHNARSARVQWAEADKWRKREVSDGKVRPTEGRKGDIWESIKIPWQKAEDVNHSPERKKYRHILAILR